jgi:acetylornithine deacetylase/succinyl-diaminopimelate desuccinylase-like protein
MIEPRHLNDLLSLLRFASISTDPAFQAQMQLCADWIRSKFTNMGLECQIHETPGHPIVLARSPRDPAKKTVLIYGHYDVQPVDPLKLWTHPPFEPYLENGIVYARGATDNKGQFLAHILGVQETVASGQPLPVNLIFLIEGEEEIGSPHLPAFLEKYRQELACDIVVISDTGMLAPGVPTFTYGLRGITALELTLKGPSKDLHSGIYGGAVANPLTELCRLIATLHDAEGRVAVEGFYEDVRELQDWERQAWAQLPITDTQLLALTGSPSLVGESGYTATERTWARPTAELNGISGGYQGAGTKTVLPSQASAKLTFRLVPDQEPEILLNCVIRHLKKYCPDSVTMEINQGHSGRPYLVDPLSPYGLAAQRALSKAFGGASCCLIREGGSIPIVASFKELLGVDTLLLGLALPDCCAHSPDENFPLANFAAGIRLNQELLKELSL